MMVITVLVLSYIRIAKKNPNLYIRRISGIEAIDEALGRATEMGKPCIYIPGISSIDDIATLASISALTPGAAWARLGLHRSAVASNSASVMPAAEAGSPSG